MNPRQHKQSRILLSLFVLYCMAAPWDITPLLGGLSPASIVGALLVVAWCFIRADDASIIAVPTSALVFAFCYLMAITGSGFWTPADSILRTLFSQAVSVMIFIVAIDLLQDYRSYALDALAVGGASLSLALVAVGDVAEWSRRRSLLGADENITAFVLSVSLATCVWGLHRHGIKASVGYGAMIGVLTAGILSTGSRTGIVAILLILVSFVVLAFLKKYRLTMGKVLLLSSGAIVAFPMLA